MPKDLWKAFHLQRIQFERWPDGIRAWITILTMTGCSILVVCVLIAVVSLTRLGWDALASTGPASQEAARNFLLGFAGALGAPFLVWRSWIAQQQANAVAEQARAALQNHISGIFAKSVELLGLMRETKVSASDGTSIVSSVVSWRPNVEARLGALYSLERLLRESEQDQRAILETLCAYVRENSPLEIPDTEKERSAFLRGEAPPSPSRRADVQAAITIIGRRPQQLRDRATIEGWQLDLRTANLVGYDFSDLNYDQANLSNSFLNTANLSGASFANSVIADAFLEKADLRRTCFRSAELRDCDLSGAKIEATNFQFANLINTDLRTATVVSFAIEGANLEKALNSFILKHALERVMEGGGASGFYATEILNTIEFFQRATSDKDTRVPQEVRDAIDFVVKRDIKVDTQKSEAA